MHTQRPTKRQLFQLLYKFQDLLREPKWSNDRDTCWALKEACTLLTHDITHGNYREEPKPKPKLCSYPTCGKPPSTVLLHDPRTDACDVREIHGYCSLECAYLHKVPR